MSLNGVTFISHLFVNTGLTHFIQTMSIACLVVLHIFAACEDIKLFAYNVTRMSIIIFVAIIMLTGNCLTKICNKDVHDFTVH